MPELNARQFNFKAESPDQLAIPGMEHLSHPWAQHLARGMQLHYAHDPETHENLLYAWKHNPNARTYTHPDPSRSADWDHIHGVMQWADHTDRTHGPGEITWIENTGRYNDTIHGESSGVAGALMRSAHHFDFGQDTVPLHSPARTEEGDKFASKVMPELKPTGRIDGSRKPVYGNGRPEHPYEIQGKLESAERVKSLRPRRGPQREQLFPTRGTSKL